MEELDILLQNVLTLNKMIMMREKPQNLESVKQEIRRSPMRKRKLSTPWKIVKMRKLRFYSQV